VAVAQGHSPNNRSGNCWQALKTGEESSLLTHIAMTENVSLCTRMKT
jgi:hypothetical protein